MFAAQIPIAEPAARPTEAYLPRFRALALFERRPPERVDSSSLPASENLHRSGLDTLASSGSCHRTKAAAFRRELELLLLPVGSLPTSGTCPLRSTGITAPSLLIRSSPPLAGASVLSASRLEPLVLFPLPSPARFSRSARKPSRGSRRLYAGCRSGGLMLSPELIPGDGSTPGSDIA